MTARIRCNKCEAESYHDGATKIYCPTCFAQLEAENERLRAFAQDMICRAGYDVDVDDALGEASDE